MTTTNMTLVDWLDDLCVRFIVNLPNEELQSVERICFQIEEAQWFYEDFIRPLDPNNLPSMHLRKFSQLMFQHCPLFSAYSEALHQQAYEQFLAYKTRVPVRGAIMLNTDMTHAVLVKGWKKSAKWSFPRGKINKEETDLDCAVREVYEETGYDLYEGNLVAPEEQMKKITVTMREQSMMLYVFRGVPMDTYFEPRTRKEISKIDWYKLTDLPTLRRKNHMQNMQVQDQGQEQIKESSFYMVAPFLGPLRAWIKQQHKLDRQRARNSTNAAALPIAMTDDEDLHPEIYEAMADEAVPVALMPSSDNLAHLVAQLGQARPSNTLSEMSSQQPNPQPPDPAAELKRLLSVGVGMQSPPVEAPSSMPTPAQQANPLLALFHQGNSQQNSGMHPPRTPFDQIMPSPIQPSSPHGQHQPRQPQMGNMGPPPSFQYHHHHHHHHQQIPVRGPPQFNGMPFPHSNQYVQPLQHTDSSFPHQQPNMQQAFDQRNPRMVQETSDSHFSGDHGRPTIPPASKLPAPNLNSHTLGLLNSFKSNSKGGAPSHPAPTMYQNQQSANSTLRIQQPLPQRRPHDLASPQASYTPIPPQFHSPPVHSNFQPEQPTPRSLHQDSLLTLFKGTSPVASPEPVELSAYPKTPGHMASRPVDDNSRVPKTDFLVAASAGSSKKNVTQATVSGPVNVPDFETVKKHSLPINNNSRGASPQIPFMPQQILKRGSAGSVSRASLNATTVLLETTRQSDEKATVASQATFKPQILKRNQLQNATLAPPEKQTAHTRGLLDMFKGPSPHSIPAHPVRNVQTSRSPAPPTGHTQGLLDMFKGPSPHPVAAQPSRSPVPPAGHTQGLLDMFKAASPQSQPQPPTHPASQTGHKQDLLNMFKSPSPLPSQSTRTTFSPASTSAPATAHRRDFLPGDQKSNLLSLFNNPSSQSQDGTPLQPSRSPATSAFPYLPKHSVSGLNSPVSPLPATGSRTGSTGQTISPANAMARGSVSSGGARDEGVALHGSDGGGGTSSAFSASALRAASTPGDGAKSPVDKTFLLGLLEDVARRG